MLSLPDWHYLAIAVKELCFARVRHATRPVGDILRVLQTGRPPSPAGRREEIDMARLSWALDAAAARGPWRSDCLLRVMAADRWLRRYGYEPKFFLGAAKLTAGQFGAHAWLRCGDVTVTGGSSKEFTELMMPPTSPPRADL
jgi:hypothetical protein